MITSQQPEKSPLASSPAVPENAIPAPTCCDICQHNFRAGDIVNDCPTYHGPWGFLCGACFSRYGMFGGTRWAAIDGGWMVKR